MELEISFTESQLRTIAGILADAGQVSFASAVAPFLVGINNINIPVLPSGIALTIACWLFSIIVAGRITNDQY